MNYQDKLYKGENGKQYWVGAQKLIPPLSNGANYEVKYQEFEQGKPRQDILLGAWYICKHCQADSWTNAILQAKEELREVGIII